MHLQESGTIKAYHADCMEVMKTFADKHFDLAIVDPPYGIGEDGSKNLPEVNLPFQRIIKHIQAVMLKLQI